MKAIISAIIISLFALASCKKDMGINNEPYQLIKDGLYSPEIGKMINIPSSDGFLLDDPGKVYLLSYNKLYEVNLISETIEILLTADSMLVYPNIAFDNKSVAFRTRYNGKSGWFQYHFASGTITKMFSEDAFVQQIKFSDDFLWFLSMPGQTAPFTAPCTAPWDYWCGGLPVPRPDFFPGRYVFDKTSKDFRSAPGDIITVTQDGNRSAISSWSKVFTMDNANLNLMDSANFQYNAHGPFGEQYQALHLGDVLKLADRLLGPFRLLNAKTGQVLLSLTDLNWADKFWFSHDGKMLYLAKFSTSEPHPVNPGRFESYNIETGERKILSSRHHWKFIISKDGNRMLTHASDGFYIKEIL